MGRPKGRKGVENGTKCGAWTVIGPVFIKERKKGYGISYHNCRCECGIERPVQLGDLKCGRSRSCGCQAMEVIKAANRTHGGTGTRLYRIWGDIKRRCFNKKHKRFATWGGRGISMCESWQEFSVFQKWAMKKGYQDDLEIDRKNTNGNYEPRNCRWVTDKTQAENRRTTRFVEIFGEKKSMFDWSKDERCQMSYTTFGNRLRRGMAPELALKKSRS